MSQSWRAERLPCGRELGGIVEQVGDGRGDQPDAHQRTCLYCQTAIEDTERMWGPVRRYAQEPVEIPDELVESLVRRVRRLIDIGWIKLSKTAREVTKVSGWIVAAIAELAAGRTAGVSGVGSSAGRVEQAAQGGRPRGDGERSVLGGRAVEVGDREAAIDLELTTQYGPDIHSVAEAVRRNVRREVGELTGLSVVEVNIHVHDVDDV